MRRTLPIALALSICAFAFEPSIAEAGELKVHYGAIQKLLETRFFVEEGSYYVQGSTESLCNYTRLQEPQVLAAGERLVIRMQFASRVGTEIRDRCVGTNDTFGIDLSGVPVYADGVLRLSDVAFEAEKPGVGALVGPFVKGPLTDALQFPLRERIEEAAHALWAETGVGLRVPRLEVPAIVLGENQLRVTYDFDVDLR